MEIIKKKMTIISKVGKLNINELPPELNKTYIEFFNGMSVWRQNLVAFECHPIAVGKYEQDHNGS